MASNREQLRSGFWDYEPPWIRTGDWLVHPRENQLSRGEQRTTLEPRLMDLLLYFLTHAGDVLSTDALLQAIWGGTFYSDNPVHRSIALLRRALGDAAHQPRFLLTVRKRGYQWIGSVGFPDHAPIPVGESWTGRCPYRGAMAFEQSWASVFFGRQRATAEVLKVLGAQQQAKRALVLLSGASGVGKSSLLHAGLIPALVTAGQIAPDCISLWDVRQTAAGQSLEPLCIQLGQMSPNGRPLFVATEARGLAWLVEHDFAEFCIRMQRRLSHLALAQDSGCGATNRMLLAIDHLDALLTSAQVLCRQDELSSLDRLLHWLATETAVLIVLAARSDQVEALDALLPSCMALAHDTARYFLKPTSHAEIAAIIRGPARLAGLFFERDAHTQARLDDVLWAAASDQPDCVPLLQPVLTTLYASRGNAGLLHLADYHALGGLDGQVAAQAERVIQAVPDFAAALDGVLRRMLRLDLSTDMPCARWVPWIDLDASEAVLVNQLVAQRLLVSDWVAVLPGAKSAACFRPAHNALIHHWPRVQRWCTTHARPLRTHASLRQASAIWRDNGQRADLLLNAGKALDEAQALRAHRQLSIAEDEIVFLNASGVQVQQRKRSRIRLLIGLAGALLVSLLVGLFAIDQRHDAAVLRESAQSTVDYLVDDLAERIRPQGNLDLMQAIGERAVASQQDNPPRNRSAVLRKAKALRLSGEVAVGQGDTPSALAVLEQAQSILEPFARPVLTNAVALELGTIHYWLGYIEYRRAALYAAEQHWQRYFALAEELVAREPHNADWQLELSYAINNLGTLARERRQWPEASVYFSRSEAIKTTLFAHAPHDMAIAADLADTRSWLARVLESSGALTAARDRYRAQVALLEQVSAGEGPGIEWQFRLAVARTHVARVELSLGQVDAALGDLERAQHSLQSLVKHDPSNQLWRYNLAYADLQLGWILSLRGVDPSAHYRTAQAQWKELPSDAKNTVIWQRLDALLQRLRGEQQPAAVAAQGLQAAVGALRGLHASAPADFNTALLLAQTVARLAERENDAGKERAAAQHWREVLALLADSGFSQDPEAMSVTVRAFAGLGDAENTTRIELVLQGMGYQHPDFLRWSKKYRTHTYFSLNKEMPGLVTPPPSSK